MVRTLTDEDLEAIAELVESILDGRNTAGRFLDTAGVAALLMVSPDFIRDHRGELGGIRVGDSARGPLRFERAKVLRAMEARSTAAPPAKRGSRRRPGPRHSPRAHDVELLPIPEGGKR